MIPFKTFEAAVRALAAKYPDRVYKGDNNTAPACHYLPDEANPDGCIIGAALRDVGVTLQPGWDAHAPSLGDVLTEAGVEFTERERRWTARVQSSQDNGYSWGKAVLTADETQPLTDKAPA